MDNGYCWIKIREGHPDFSYEPLNFTVPVYLKSALSAEQLNLVKEKIFKDYVTAMQALEHSITIVSVTHERSSLYLDELCTKLFQIVLVYCEVDLEDKLKRAPSRSELMLRENRFLIDVFSHTRVNKNEASTSEIVEGGLCWPGEVGLNPLVLRKVFFAGNLREKGRIAMTFACQFMPTIFNDKALIDKMNRKLIRVVDWQIKVDDANPVYRSGIYTAENEKQSLRIFIKSEAERSRLAPQIRNYPIKDDSRRLIPLSAWEKRFATGELLPSETNVSESLVRAYKEKAEEKTIWLPGLAWYSLTKNKERKIPHPYLKAVEALALPVIAGISGTCDYIMTMGAYLGLNQQNDLVSARIAMLGFLSDIQNHTVCEVMMASKSFGMQYKPRADFYKDICPKDPKFIERLQEQQSIQNVLMPDEYLTESYMLSKTKELGFM